MQHFLTCGWAAWLPFCRKNWAEFQFAAGFPGNFSAQGFAEVFTGSFEGE